jgi:hypothetical protein
MTSYPFERNSDSWVTISSSEINTILIRGKTKLRILLLAMIAGSSSFAQSPVQEVGDEKEPGTARRIGASR